MTAAPISTHMAIEMLLACRADNDRLRELFDKAQARIEMLEWERAILSNPPEAQS